MKIKTKERLIGQRKQKPKASKQGKTQMHNVISSHFRQLKIQLVEM